MKQLELGRLATRGDNHGVLIVVAVQDRKSRIETSNNVASKITDYQTHRFLTTARPYFKMVTITRVFSQ